MATAQKCGKCGAELTAFATEGFCSACMLEGALSSESANPANKLTLRRRFGDYELLEEIARGGMGVVYRAKQLGLNRTVAVKMILSGQFASEGELQRFRSEAEAVASLQHPSIVAVHEVGEHDSQLFFSMDYVEGPNLAQLVRDGPLASVRAAQCVKAVAEAIQYAHERGILHRDLKPSNILLDAQGRPHVTDFGLAKQLDDSQLSTLNSQLTITGQVLGSPNFMPPEQAAGSRKDVGPASDVYSLGAILYHLMTGRAPFLADSVTATLRLVAETEPAPPRLLVPNVPRDLETITLKCLEKDPRRRYASASELAEELGRFLRDEPIRARAVSGGEKAWRWRRRNPALAGTAAVGGILLLMVAIGSPIAAFRINRGRLAAEAGRTQAKLEAAKSKQVAEFLKDMLDGVGPTVALGRDTRMLREILDKTAERVSHDLTNQPAVEAELRATIGQVYTDLGEYGKAEAMHRRALELRRKLFGNENLEVARSLNRLAAALEDQAKNAEAEKLDREALAIQRKLLGNEHIEVAWSLNSLSVQLEAQGKGTEAELLCREALAMRRKLLGNDHRDVAMTLNNLGGHEIDNSPAEAEKIFREAVRILRARFGDEHPDLEIPLDNLALALQKQGKFAECEARAREALALQRKVLGPSHPHVLRSLWILSDALVRQDKLAEAETVTRDILAIERGRFGNEHEGTVNALKMLYSLLIRQGKPDSLEELPPFQRAEIQGRAGRWKEAVAEFAKAVQSEPANIQAAGLLASVLVANGDLEGYRQHCTRLVARFASTTDAGVADRLAKCCLILPSSGVDLEIMGELAERAVRLGKQSPYLPWFQLCKGLAEYRQGHFAEATNWTQKTLASAGPQLERDAAAYLVLAMAQMNLKQENVARIAWRKAATILNQKLPKLDAGDLGNQWGDRIIAEALMREATKALDGERSPSSGTSEGDK